MMIAAAMTITVIQVVVVDKGVPIPNVSHLRVMIIEVMTITDIQMVVVSRRSVFAAVLRKTVTTIITDIKVIEDNMLQGVVQMWLITILEWSIIES